MDKLEKRLRIASLVLSAAGTGAMGYWILISDIPGPKRVFGAICCFIMAVGCLVNILFLKEK